MRVLFLICISAYFFADINAQKIPITSLSEEAKGYYQKGWASENTFSNEAKTYYKKALQVDSTFSLAYLRLAMLNPSRKERGDLLKKAVEYSTEISEGEKLWILGRYDFYRAGNNGLNEYNYFKELVELYPKDEVANFLFGYVNVVHGRNDIKKAAKYYEKAIQLNPNYIAPYNELIYRLSSIKEYAKAKVIAENYIELLPNEASPYDAYAELLMSMGDYDNSIKTYEKVLKIDSEYPWAIMGIAANLNFLDKHAKARKFLKKLNENNLSDYEYRHLWRSQVVSFIDEGNLNGALDILEKQKQASLKEINKREPRFHIYYTFLRRTRLFFEDEDSFKGMEEYEKWNAFMQENYENKSTKSKIKNLKIYYSAFKSYLNGDYPLALDLIKQYESLNTKPTDMSLMLKARVFIMEQNYTMAVETLKKTNLDNPFNQYWLANAYLKLGNEELANYWKNEVLQMNDRNDIDLALVRKKAKNL